MKASHLLVGAVFGAAVAALLVSKKTSVAHEVPGTAPSTDDDLLKWTGDPAQVKYEIPSDLIYNGETLRDFCGSFWDIRDRSPWHAELNKLADAIRSYAEADWADVTISEETRRDNINRTTEDLRGKVVEAWLIAGVTHNIILNWMNGDFDVSKLTQLDINNLHIVAFDKTLPAGVTEYAK